MKGVIYIRVSSEEQVLGTSLDEQKKSCQGYCQNSGIEIVEIFREEGESAKNLKLNNRKEFLRALEFCRKNKGKIGAFVVHKVDRFARNTEDHFLVRKTLLDYGTTLHSVTEPIGNKPVEKFVETMLAASAEFDNAIRKQRCCDGQSARINQGIYPHKCPVGYVSGRCKLRGVKKTEPDLPDEKIFPIIQRGLKEFKKGVISKTELADLLEKWGLAKLRGKKTTIQFVEKMLTQHLRFYAGILHNAYTGEYVRGLHTPMISEEEMREIQFVLSGKNKHSVKKNRYNADFPLRGTVLCSVCLETVTGSITRGNGGNYFYYHCKKKGCSMYGKSLPKMNLENDFFERLKQITPKDEFLELFKETVIDLWNEKTEDYQFEVERQKKVVEELECRKKRIFEMREDGSYSVEEFADRKNEIENKITAEKISLNETKIDQLDIETVLSFTIQFIKDVSRQWFDLPPQLRPRFQKLIFPEGITYDREKGLGTAKLGVVYEVIELLAQENYRLVDLDLEIWNTFCEIALEWEPKLKQVYDQLESDQV